MHAGSRAAKNRDFETGPSLIVNTHAIAGYAGGFGFDYLPRSRYDGDVTVIRENVASAAGRRFKGTYSMNVSESDLQYVEGLLAVQRGLLNEQELSLALADWREDEASPFREFLVERKLIGADQADEIREAAKEFLSDREARFERFRTLTIKPDAMETLRRIPDQRFQDLLDRLNESDSAVEPSPTVTVAFPQTSGMRYQVLRPHARGGLGEVFVARDLEIPREVALKQIRDEHANDQDCLTRFLLESAITGGLEHPGIVPVYGQGTHPDGRPYYAMRFIRGMSLKAEIDRFHKESSPAKAGAFRSIAFHHLLRRFVDVCNALEYAHSRGILHRDLKPSNVMLGKFGETLVVDWGLAKSLDTEDDALDSTPMFPPASPDTGTTPTQMGSVVGTPAYMSPEQAAGRLDQLSPQSDVFSLGAMLYCILCGRPPHTKTDLFVVLREVESGTFPKPREINPHIPRALESICLKAMSLKPADRYAGAAAMGLDIENWLADHRVSAHPDTLRDRIERWIRHHKSVVASLFAATVVLCISSVVGIYLWNRSEQEAFRRKQESENRLADIRANALAGEGAGLLELKADNLSSAASFFRRSLAELGQDPEFEELRQQLAARLNHAEDLIEFYRWSDRCNYATFFEYDMEAIVAAVTALKRLRVFEHDDWWSHLPTRELTAAQADRLRREVYWQLANLASLLSKHGMFYDQVEEIRLSQRVIERAQAYRPSRWLESVYDSNKIKLRAEAFGFSLRPEHMMQLATIGRFRPIPRLNWRPFLPRNPAPKREEIRGNPNPIDGYFFGSVSLVLAVQPEGGFMRSLGELGLIPGAHASTDVAADYISHAVTLVPDHYWLHLALGWCEAKRENYDLARRSYGHAIALEPENPLAYGMRSSAWLDEFRAAASSEDDSVDHKILLARAMQDASRGLSLAPFLYYTHFYIGNALIAAGQIQEGQRAYRVGIELANENVSLQKERFISPLGEQLIMCKDSANEILETAPNPPETLALLALIHITLNDLAEARSFADRAIELDPKQATAQIVRGRLFLLEHQPSRAEEAFRSALANRPQDFRAALGLGRSLELSNKPQEAMDAFAKSKDFAKADWQESEALAGQARALIRLNRVKEAEKSTADAWKVNPLLDLAELKRLAALNEADDLLKQIEGYEDLGIDADHALAIQNLPVRNGDFELALASYWGEDHLRLGRPIWFNANGCESTARRAPDSREGESGMSFQIANTSARGFGRFGTMSQTIPAQRGSVYQLTFSAKGRGLAEGAVECRIDAGGETHHLPLPPGTWDWREVQLDFPCERDSLNLQIRSQDRGEAWIDDISIRRIPSRSS